MKRRIAILISGRGSNMEALIGAAAAADYPASVGLVVSNRADAAGLDVARREGVHAVVVSAKKFGGDRVAHERAIDEVLRDRQTELVCLAGYMRILTPFFVQRWRGKMLNIHPSLLPAYPGLNTHARVLAAGEVEHGCTVHLVTETMDDGPILAQARVKVLPGDTEEALAARVLAAEHALYPAALADFIAGLPMRAPPLPGPAGGL